MCCFGSSFDSELHPISCLDPRAEVSHSSLVTLDNPNTDSVRGNKMIRCILPSDFARVNSWSVQSGKKKAHVVWLTYRALLMTVERKRANLRVHAADLDTTHTPFILIKIEHVSCQALVQVGEDKERVSQAFPFVLNEVVRICSCSVLRYVLNVQITKYWLKRFACLPPWKTSNHANTCADLHVLPC